MGNCLFRPRHSFVPVLFFLAVFHVCAWGQTPSSPPLSNPSNAYDLALRAMQQRDYAEALDRMQEAIGGNPTNLEYQYVLGLVYLRLERLDEAEVIFATLLREDEGHFQKAFFELASILMQRGKINEAIEALGKARPLDPGRADYETGVAYMRIQDYPKAVEFLKRAAIAKPELATEAAIQEAIAQYHMKHYKDARDLLVAVSRKQLSPEKREEVQALLASMESSIRASKPWQVIATAGLQFDNNVLQDPLQQVNAAPAGGATDAEDMAGLISVSGRYNLYQTEPWKFGVGYNHYQLTYADHSSLNLIGARPTVYFQWEKSPYFATVEYVYSHYWVDGDSRVDVQSIFPRFVMLHGDRFRTEIFTGAEWRFYQDTTPDDRLFHLGVMEYYLLRNGTAHLRAGYQADYDNMVPTERASFLSHTGAVGVQWPIWKEKWFLDLSGAFIWRNYDRDVLISSTTSRQDEEQDLNVMVFGRLTPSLQMSVLFQRIWSNSNITNQYGVDPYNYRRAILTCMLTYYF